MDYVVFVRMIRFLLWHDFVLPVNLRMVKCCDDQARDVSERERMTSSLNEQDGGVALG